MNFFLLFTFYFVFAFPPVENENAITIHFHHVVNNQSLEKGKTFLAASGDTIAITKLKYYISHLQLQNEKGKFIDFPGIYLIDAFASDSIVTHFPQGKYTGLRFLLGVDSALHTAGVQEGALDPLNDMYWAWNTGYVNFKLEGHSLKANTDLHRIEYHIGGFAARQKTMQGIKISLPEVLIVKEKNNNKICVQVSMEKLWDEAKEISAGKLPVVIRAGDDAVKISNQFGGMFTSERIAKQPFEESTKKEK